MTGLEPATAGTTTRYSTKLSYNHQMRIIIKLNYWYFFVEPKLVAEPAGFEPVTSAVTGQRSNQLSYDSIICKK